MQRALSFGPYLLLERLGVGARSEVFRAARKSDPEGETFALKRALAGAAHDRETQFVLRAEAELLSKLSHPGIVKVIEHGDVAGTTFVAYELVKGVDLERLMAAARAPQADGSRGRLPLAAALEIGLAVAEALDYVHHFRDGAQTTPIVHRDVGPSNILIGYDGSVKLADFGIAKVPGRDSTTGVGEIKGTVRYMSPEQVKGEPLDPRSDLYGLGALLLELASGQLLFEGKKPVQVLQLLAAGDRVDPDQVDPGMAEDLRNILRKVLAYEPRERYDTAANLVEALRGLDALAGEISSPNGSEHHVAQQNAGRGRQALVGSMGELFPPDRRSGSNRTILEESQIMADEKGGSDLDVFEGLAKKSVRPSNLPGSTSGPPPGHNPSAPPAPPKPSAVPPPSLRSAGKTTLLGVQVPALPLPTSTPLPAPASMRPSVKTVQGVSAVPPPPVSARTPLPPPPPGSSGLLAAVSSPSANPAPPKPPTPSAPPPMSKAPNTLVAAVAPPPKPAVSIGSQLGIGSSPPAAADANGARDDGEEKTPPAGTAAKAGANLDMDWEDDEESTHVFEKRRHAQAMSKGPRPAAGAPSAPPPAVPPPAAKVLNAALLASSGTAAPRSVAQPFLPPAVPPPPQVPVMPAEVQHAPSPAQYAPQPRRDDPPVSRRRREGSKLGVVLGVLALLAVVGLAVIMLVPRTGQLKIEVKTKSEKAIGKLDIFVDGQKRCDTTPCTVDDLEAGPHKVKVVLGELQAVEDVRVDSSPNPFKSNKSTPVFITIDDGEKGKTVATTSATPSSSAAVVAEGTGFRVAGPSGVKVLVDGKERGELGSSALTLTDLTPGDHKVKFDGGERYESTEKTITVNKDKVEDLGQQKPKVIKGKLTLELKTTGAEVLLAGKQDDKKVEKKLKDEVWAKPPVTLNLESKDEWKLTAKKKGFQDFSEEIKFEDGVAEKTIVIELVEVGKPTPPVATSTATVRPTATTTATATSTAASGTGTLKMNSNPISKVILDGRPLGNTPQVQTVSAGKHNVTFVHPEKGRKSVTVDVKAGGSGVAAVKFD